MTDSSVLRDSYATPATQQSADLCASQRSLGLMRESGGYSVESLNILGYPYAKKSGRHHNSSGYPSDHLLQTATWTLDWEAASCARFILAAVHCWLCSSISSSEEVNLPVTTTVLYTFRAAAEYISKSLSPVFFLCIFVVVVAV